MFYFGLVEWMRTKSQNTTVRPTPVHSASISVLSFRYRIHKSSQAKTIPTYHVYLLALTIWRIGIWMLWFYYPLFTHFLSLLFSQLRMESEKRKKNTCWSSYSVDNLCGRKRCGNSHAHLLSMWFWLSL